MPSDLELREQALSLEALCTKPSSSSDDTQRRQLGEASLCLSNALCARGRENCAWKVADWLAVHDARDAAETVYAALGALPHAQRGRAFAALPQQDCADSGESVSRIPLQSQRHAIRRPRPAPDAHAYLLPEARGWAVWTPGASSGQVLSNTDTHAPAHWLDAETILFARDTGLHAHSLHSGEQRHLWTVPRSIVGLLPRRGCVLIAVQSQGGYGPDLFVLDTPVGTVRRSSNLSLQLEGDALAWSKGVVCMGAGIQSAELRLLQPEDGSWRTSTVHQARVKLLAPGRVGRFAFVSGDSSGSLLFWGRERFTPVAQLRQAWPQAWRELGWIDGIYDAQRKALHCFAAAQQWLFVVGEQARVLNTEALRAPPLGFCDASKPIPLAAADGWIWWNTRTGSMPIRWQGLAPREGAPDGRHRAAPSTSLLEIVLCADLR